MGAELIVSILDSAYHKLLAISLNLHEEDTSSQLNRVVFVNGNKQLPLECHSDYSS